MEEAPEGHVPPELAEPEKTGTSPTPGRRSSLLLDLDGGPDFLELLLDGGRLFLGDALLDHLGGAVHQVLGLLETEAGDFAHDLDHVDLLVARGHEVHGE